MAAAIPRWSSWRAPARPSITGLDDAIARARAYEATGVDALFFTGLKTRANWKRSRPRPAADRARRLPEEMVDPAYLVGQRVQDRVAGTRAVRRGNAGRLRDAESAARWPAAEATEGACLAELTGRVTRDADIKARSADSSGSGNR